jgi:hypothetical protein
MASAVEIRLEPATHLETSTRVNNHVPKVEKTMIGV